MPSTTEIANLALGHIGVAKEIQNIDTDRAQEAQACRRYFVPTRDEVLRDFPWPFATRSLAALGLVTDMTSTDGAEFSFSYRYPSDCLMFRKICSGLRTDTQETRVPYRVMSDSQGKLIFCDKEDATCEYTALISDTSLWPSDFVTAFTFLLASRIAPRVTAGDPFKMGERAEAKYYEALSKAQKNALNEDQPDRTPESEFIRIRGGAEQANRTFLGQDITSFPAQD